MRRKLKWIIPLTVLALLAAGLALFVLRYYPADEVAKAALRSDDAVRVSRTDYGWLFDGPSEQSALVFYPGACVEAAAYAPLLHRLAGAGMDACLVEMPLGLAFLGIDRAGDVMAGHDYARWYVGGHSLGGACAGRFAAAHGDGLSGVVLLAGFLDRPLDEGLDALLIYGTEDGVLNMDMYRKNLRYAPAAAEYVIEGGNHAQFGAYGAQRGDGIAAIPAEVQWDRTVRRIVELDGSVGNEEA